MRPGQRVEADAGRRRRNALQSEVFEQRLAAALILALELRGGLLEGRERSRIDGRLGITRRVEPGGERPGAGGEARQALPIAARRGNARQVVVQRREMVDRVTESNQAGPDGAEVRRFQ